VNNFQKYFLVSVIDEQWGFNLTTVGFHKTAPGELYPINKTHPVEYHLNWNEGRMLHDFQVVFIVTGRGVFETKHTPPYSVEEGTIMFLYPGVWHRYKPDTGTGWNEFWVGLKGEIADILINNIFPDKLHPIIKTGNNKEVLFLFQKLIETVQVAEQGYYRLASAIVFRLLNVLYLQRLNIYQGKNEQEYKIEKAKYLLLETLHEPVQLTKIAQQVNMGYSAFRKNFKQITGVSPNAYLLNLRLEKVKDLLVSTSLSVQEIALESGFGSIHYLSKFFTKKMKCTPSHYRASYKKS
jgi:AraC-like DNA-binding protein